MPDEIGPGELVDGADDLEHPDFDEVTDDELVSDGDLALTVLSPEGDPAKLAEYAQLFGTDQ